MLTESIAVAVQAVDSKRVTASTLKDVGVVIHEIQPESTVRQVFKKSSVAIDGLAISNTHIFAVQADKACVNVYNREKGNQEASVFFPDKVTSIAIQDADTANFAVLGMANGGLVIWEVLTGRVIFTNHYHTQAITVVRIHSNSNLILTGSTDTNVQIWDLAQIVSLSGKTVNSPLRAFNQHRSAVADVIFSHGASYSVVAISAARDGTCYIWDPNTARISRTILLNVVPQCLAIDPIDRCLYVGSDDGSISSIDFSKTFVPLSRKDDGAVNGSKIQEQSFLFTRLPEGSGAVNELAVSYDSTALFSGHSDGKVYAWDNAKGKVRHMVVDIGQPVTCLQALIPDRLKRKSKARFQSTRVVKPKPAETFAIGNENGTSGIPANYNIQIHLENRRTPTMVGSFIPGQEYGPPVSTSNAGFFTEGPFQQSLLDEGLAEFSSSATSQAQNLGKDEVPSNMNGKFVSTLNASANTAPQSVADFSTNVELHARIKALEHELAKKEKEISGFRYSLARNIGRRTQRLDRFEGKGDQLWKEYHMDIDKGVPDDEALKQMYIKLDEWDRFRRQQESDEEELAAVTGEVRKGVYERKIEGNPEWSQKVYLPSQ